MVSFAPAQQPAATYFIQVAWVSSQGQEGAASDPTSFDAATGSAPVVSSLNPPKGATGFNVYIGLTPTNTGLQNGAAIPVGESFTLPSIGLVQGRAPGTGQNPDTYVTGGPALRRG